jgi:multicomponent Na+:H+ antiporter subunit B
MKRAVDLLTLALVSVFLVAALSGAHPGGGELRDYFVANGEAETGAVNLVTSIYLGYRAWDTLGETMVLLLAVAGISVILERRR